MKKMICAILALSLVFALAACGGSKPEETTAPVANIEGTMEELLNKVIEQRPVEFSGGVIPIDLTDTSEDGAWAVKSFTGLEDASQITEAAAYEPMIGSIAFSMVVLRVNEGEDAKAVAQEMKDNINTRKWMCVEAGDLQVVGYGDVVMLIMVDENFAADGITSQAFVDAFKAVCGADLDFTI